MPDTPLMTAEELAGLPDTGLRYELSDGKLICMSPSGSLASIVAGRVLVRVGGFVDRHRLSRTEPRTADFC
jgi:Uma2 family endonuclease